MPLLFLLVSPLLYVLVLCLTCVIPWLGHVIEISSARGNWVSKTTLDVT
jgi:hypothetical protein